MAIADGHGLPIAVRVTSSSPNESTLIEDTHSQRHVGGLPKRLSADRAYDRDRLDERLREEHSVELIVLKRRRSRMRKWPVATAPKVARAEPSALSTCRSDGSTPECVDSPVDLAGLRCRMEGRARHNLRSELWGRG